MIEEDARGRETIETQVGIGVVARPAVELWCPVCKTMTAFRVSPTLRPQCLRCLDQDPSAVS